MAFCTIMEGDIEWAFHVSDEGGYVTASRNSGPHQQIVSGRMGLGKTILADATTLEARARAWLAEYAEAAPQQEVSDGEYFSGAA